MGIPKIAKEVSYIGLRTDHAKKYNSFIFRHQRNMNFQTIIAAMTSVFLLCHQAKAAQSKGPAWRLGPATKHAVAEDEGLRHIVLDLLEHAKSQAYSCYANDKAKCRVDALRFVKTLLSI